MHKMRAVLGFTVVLAISLSILPLVGHSADEPLVLDEGGFEVPPVLEAKDFLAPELFKGDHFQVDPYVLTDGFENRYTITSDFGPFLAHGDDMLRVRLGEIRALAKMAEIKKTKAFATAVTGGLKSPLVATGNLLRNPVGTLTGVPKGAWRYVTRIGEMARGRRGKHEDSVVKELIGFGSTKRGLASRLKVDVYSSNQILQKELNGISWAIFAGGMVPNAVMMGVTAVSSAAATALKVTRKANSLNQILKDNAPEDLRRLNRKKLQKIGERIKGDTKALLNHRWYSPSHTTYLVGALESLEGVQGRDGFINLANMAESEEEAFFFQRIAQMMEGYHLNVAPVTEVEVIHGLATCHTAENYLVVPLVIDYGVWTQNEAILSEAIQRAVTEEKASKLELWVSGSLSARAKEEFMGRGWEVHDHAYDTLFPAPPPSSSEDDEQGNEGGQPSTPEEAAS